MSCVDYNHMLASSQDMSLQIEIDGEGLMLARLYCLRAYIMNNQADETDWSSSLVNT